MLNVYLSYYQDPDPKRRKEIDACVECLCNNRSISRLIVLTEAPLPAAARAAITIPQDVRPAMASIFDLITNHSGDNDVNMVINSDCFFDERDAAAINAIGPDDAYCLLRVEISRAVPLRVDRRKTKRNIKKHEGDMQDCWIIRGRPKAGMWLDFNSGTPGCDNRLAYELQKAGYRILNPYSRIRIYHYHRTGLRRYTARQRVPQPYAFPEPC